MLYLFIIHHGQAKLFIFLSFFSLYTLRTQYFSYSCKKKKIITTIPCKLSRPRLSGEVSELSEVSRHL
jgi:hypothetical protein